MKKKKRIILHAIRQGLIGGGETHVLDLVKHLDSTAYESHVLSFTDGPMIERLNEMQVKSRVIPTTKPFDFRVWKEVESFLRELRPDIVHAHGSRAASNLLYPCKRLSIPIIYTVHGWSFHDDQPFLVKQLRIRSEKFISDRTNLNISVSISNQITGRRYFGKYESKIINNGIDLHKFDSSTPSKLNRTSLGLPLNKTIVVCAMRMTKQKNPLTMVRAFAEALKSNPAIHLLMVGDGELKKDAERLSNELEIHPYITFLPFRTDVPDVLKLCDIYCLPSLWEGLPIGLLEAMALGLSCIATEVDGSKEIIQDGVNGLLVSPNNTKDLANALIKLSLSEELMKLFSAESVKTVREKYNVKGMVNEIDNTYQAILNNE